MKLRSRRNRALDAAAFAALVLITSLLGLPFFWMVLTSLKPVEEVILYPPRWWPQDIRWENYLDAWRAAPFGRFYANSLLVSAAATLLQVFFASTMAYAFALVRFPAKGTLLMAVLATMMVPEEMKIVPNYLLMARLDWVDRYPGLVAPVVAHAFPVFVLYQYFRTLPRDLIDAAQADGAGHLRTLFRIVLPMARPMVAAVTLIAFLGRWNDFLWPLIVTQTEGMRTLPIGLAYLKQGQEGGHAWNFLMAAAVFVIIPVVALYVAVQRHFVEGITRGALKG